MPLLAMQPKQPKPQIIRIPILTEIINMGDGTFKMRPMPMESDFDTWVGARYAAKLIGVSSSFIYELLQKPFLVWRQPAKKLYLISHRSVLDYRAITADPEFWDNEASRRAFAKKVQTQIDALKQLRIPNDREDQKASALILQR